jgi:RadC-like JAB domain
MSYWDSSALVKLYVQELNSVGSCERSSRWVVEIAKGTLNETLAHPRDIFRAVIAQSAYAFVVVDNPWAGTHRLCGVQIYLRCAGEALDYESFRRAYLSRRLHITVS